MEIHRAEPLEVEVGDRVRDERTGEVGTVVAVAEKFVRVRYDDGRERGAPRLNYHVWRLDSPRRPPPGARMPLRRAGACRLRDRIVIHGEVIVEGGPGMIAEPFLALPADASTAEQGEAILTALAAYRTGVPAPTKAERDARMRAFLKAAGVRSHRRLQQSALACWISEQDDGFDYTVLHNGGTRGHTKGFQPQRPMQWVVVPKPAEPAELGEALERTFELCTTIYASPLEAEA